MTPQSETLFIGLYAMRGRGIAPEGMLDPIHEYSVAGMYLYDLVPDPRLSEFVGKLIIDWRQGFLSWVQRAERDKPVLELRRDVIEPPFPGYLGLIRKLSEISSLPIPWIERLQEARGIYLVTCPREHEHYVGSDLPSALWTPMLAFRSWRGVSDERYAPGVSGVVQTGSG